MTLQFIAVSEVEGRGLCSCRTMRTIDRRACGGRRGFVDRGGSGRRKRMLALIVGEQRPRQVAYGRVWVETG